MALVMKREKERKMRNKHRLFESERKTDKRRKKKR